MRHQDWQEYTILVPPGDTVTAVLSAEVLVYSDTGRRYRVVSDVLLFIVERQDSDLLEVLMSMPTRVLVASLVATLAAAVPTTADDRGASQVDRQATTATADPSLRSAASGHLASSSDRLSEVQLLDLEADMRRTLQGVIDQSSASYNGARDCRTSVQHIIPLSWVTRPCLSLQYCKDIDPSPRSRRV